MPACVRDRFHTVFLGNDGWRVTGSARTPCWGRGGRREEARGGEGRQRQPEVGEAQDRKEEKGASLLKCGKTGELIEDDKVRGNQREDGSRGEGCGGGRRAAEPASCTNTLWARPPLFSRREKKKKVVCHLLGCRGVINYLSVTHQSAPRPTQPNRQL